MVAISILTIALICITLYIAVYRLWTNPPVIRLEVPVRLELTLPEKFIVQHQHLPAKAETDIPAEEPIPEDIGLYILQESEPHAQGARLRRARELKRELGSWDVAFRVLQREDAVPE